MNLARNPRPDSQLTEPAAGQQHAGFPPFVHIQRIARVVGGDGNPSNLALTDENDLARAGVGAGGGDLVAITDRFDLVRAADLHLHCAVTTSTAIVDDSGTGSSMGQSVGQRQ